MPHGLPSPSSRRASRDRSTGLGHDAEDQELHQEAPVTARQTARTGSAHLGECVPLEPLITAAVVTRHMRRSTRGHCLAAF